ncbi:hypothetical protein [Plantactinospora endophytica]|uniref:Uncharacterized protein n=1 Tax=Plantactinospora endophytica TaxID=673535 RepID=A0ABQ4DTS1_9ACTN|nr:hypothetical protein [Plantactinospora endophytica]GIG85471.1 hypothetical protein Pen02_04070 [Plantactinospora endophytica]
MTGQSSAGSEAPSPSLPVSVVSTSRAADAGYLTLADLSAIAATLAVDYRIVGGHMVTLLVAVPLLRDTERRRPEAGVHLVR